MASTVWGNKSIRNKVKITSGVNDVLNIKVDNVEYTVTLNSGDYFTSREYHTSELIEELNYQFNFIGLNVKALLGGGLNDELYKYSCIVIKHILFNGQVEVIGGSFNSEFIA